MTELDLVLYAEDDENDLFFMERAFENLKIRNPLRSLSNGKHVIDYLAGNGQFANRTEHPLPGLVLLDLSMPGKHGLEVLQWIRSQPHLAALIVIVLTSSNQESDVQRAFQFGANGYLIKPGDPDDLIRIVKGIHDYWLSGKSHDEEFVNIAALKPFSKAAN